MSKLIPEERIGASQVKSVGRMSLMEGAAQEKAWRADIAKRVSRIAGTERRKHRSGNMALGKKAGGRF